MTAKIIYLQVNGSLSDDGEVTWCVDQVNDDDIAYIRKDAAEAEVTRLRTDLASLEMTEAEGDRFRGEYERQWQEKVDKLQAESADFELHVVQMCCDLWALLYPDDPTGWQYLTQPLVHIRVELDRLQAEVTRLRSELASLETKLLRANGISTSQEE